MKRLKKIRIFGLLLCIIIVSQLFTYQVSAKTLDEIRREIANYSQELSRLEKDGVEQSKYQAVLSKQIDALSQQMQAFDNQINELNRQVGEKQLAIDKLNDKVFENEAQIEKIKLDIGSLEAEKNSIEDQLRDRVKENYLYEQSGSLEVLLSSQDFGDFISNAVYLKKVAEFDKKLTDKLDSQIDEINNEKLKIEGLLLQIRRDKDVIGVELNEVQKKVYEISKAKEGKKSVINELEKQLKKSTVKSDTIEKAKQKVQKAQTRAKCELEDATEIIRKLQNENKSKMMPKDIDVGGYLYPVAPPNYIFRGYDPSIPHYGVDIATRGKNNPIFASRGGVVIASRFGVRGDGLGGYGNVVVIDHGDGYSTLYGHMFKRHVNVGDHVTRGQCIGLVGNTGDSHGEHCHFELRRSGKPIKTPFG